MKQKILLITKRTDLCRKVQNIIQNSNVDVTILEGDRDEKFPDIDWSGDYIISYLSAWILKRNLLYKSKCNINFHPAPPKYPGSAGYNLAIYNKDSEYGVTCHHMNEIVDSGNIIDTLYFPITESETVESLKNKTHKYLFTLFEEILEKILNNETLPISDEKWAGKPYTRKDLLELCEINLNMSNTEIQRRIRATNYPGAKDKPFIDIRGFKFKYNGE